jgi:hypothetical protein
MAIHLFGLVLFCLWRVSCLVFISDPLLGVGLVVFFVRIRVFLLIGPSFLISYWCRVFVLQHGNADWVMHSGEALTVFARAF